MRLVGPSVLGLLAACAGSPPLAPCETDCDVSTMGTFGDDSTSTTRGRTDSTTTDDDSDSDASSSSTTGPDVVPTDGPCGSTMLEMGEVGFGEVLELEPEDGTFGSAVGDLDDDGRDEFVAQAPFRIFDRDDGEWSTHQPLLNLSGRGDRFAGAIELADIDDDDDLDIVVTDSDAEGPEGAISWFENDGRLDGTWTEHSVVVFSGTGGGDSVESLEQLEVGDLDDDGRLDLVARDRSHGLWIVMQREDGWALRRFIPTRPREGLTLWDPNDDGRLDILLNGIWLETPLDPTEDEFVPHPIVGMEAWYPDDDAELSVQDYATIVVAADFDQNGLIDVVIANAKELAGMSGSKPAGISVFLQPNDLLEDPWIEIPVTTERRAWHTLSVADFDHDGSLDLLGATTDIGIDDESPQISVWLNDGDADAFSPIEFSFPPAVYKGRTGDADGDGDCDLFAPESLGSGAIRYWESTVID